MNANIKRILADIATKFHPNLNPDLMTEGDIFALIQLKIPDRLGMSVANIDKLRAIGNSRTNCGYDLYSYQYCTRCKDYFSHKLSCTYCNFTCPKCFYVAEDHGSCERCIGTGGLRHLKIKACPACNGFKRIFCKDCDKCSVCCNQGVIGTLRNHVQICGSCFGCCTHRQCGICGRHEGINASERSCEICKGLSCCCHCRLCAAGCGVRAKPCPTCAMCNKCCACVPCSRCRRKSPKALLCEPCGAVCRHCCTCFTCPGCERRLNKGYKSSCCRRCQNCCVCYNDSANVYYNDGTIHHALAVSDRNVFNCKRLAGIEVEYISSRRFGPISEWTDNWRGAVDHDASCGYECITAPAAGNHLVKQITDLCNALKKGEAKTNIRCGVHVHVDARDMNWDSIRRLVRIYAYVEPFLYLLAGQHRSTLHMKRGGQGYCTPNGYRFMPAMGSRQTSLAWRTAILDGIYPMDITQHRSRDYIQHNPGKKASTRYVGLNLCPWSHGRVITGAKKASEANKDTTIEFRMHRDCIDAKRLVGWTKLLVRLVDWCKKHTDEDVEKLLACGEYIPEYVWTQWQKPKSYARQVRCKKSAARVLCELAPDCAEWIVNRIKAWRKAVRYGRRRIYYKFGTYVLGLPRESIRGSEPDHYEEAA